MVRGGGGHPFVEGCRAAELRVVVLCARDEGQDGLHFPGALAVVFVDQHDPCVLGGPAPGDGGPMGWAGVGHRAGDGVRFTLDCLPRRI